jgi:hydrogenase maturation protease
MTPPILIAGIGNIFNRDDGFGVVVAHTLAGMRLPAHVRVVDYGIRSIDLAFALMDDYPLVILVDAVSRGSPPGTLFAIEADPAAPPDSVNEGGAAFENAHSLDPASVLAAARALGASLGRIVVVGCEPESLEDSSGEIGLTACVRAAVRPAIEMILSLVKDANRQECEIEKGAVQ